MLISTRNLNSVLVIDLEGKLDTTTSSEAYQEITQHLESSPSQVIINLTPLEFVSSAGLRVILRIAKQVRTYKGAMKVAGAAGVVKEVLEISGFDSLLDLYEDEASALSSFH